MPLDNLIKLALDAVQHNLIFILCRAVCAYACSSYEVGSPVPASDTQYLHVDLRVNMDGRPTLCLPSIPHRLLGGSLSAGVISSFARGFIVYT